MIPFDNFNNEEKMERAQLYRLFAALLMEEPSIEILTELSDIFQVDINETLDEIEKDFAYLFSAPGKHLLPYESIYTGKVAGEVQAFYSSTGLIIDEERNLAADHLSTELSFMSYLIENGLAEYQSFF